MKVLITGCAGFIGFHFAKLLLAKGIEVVGVDNLNDYYDVALKRRRLELLLASSGFHFYEQDLANQEAVGAICGRHAVDHVVHLAAQAGVRYSLENPGAYMDSNILGFMSVLEACRRAGVKHLVYASSSSVYGAQSEVPFSVSHKTDRPVSLYAATKKSNEVMAYTYSHLFGIPTTGLRFFTVYGPYGRPDMAYFLFTKAILEDRPIDVFHYGNMKRDFTYIDDIVEGTYRVMQAAPQADAAAGGAPYKLYNIGNNQSIVLEYFIGLIEKYTGKTAQKNYLPLQPGDVVETFADVDDLIRDVGFRPDTPIETGLARFVDWYKGYYCGAD